MSDTNFIDPRDLEPDPPEDLSEVKTVKRRAAKANIARKALAEIVGAVMALPEGRRLVYSWLEFAGAFHNPFNANPYVTAFNSGQMNVGQKIQADVVGADPQLYLTMLKEQENED